MRKCITLDIFDEGGVSLGAKRFYTQIKNKALSNFGKKAIQEKELLLGHFTAKGNDFQNQNGVFVENIEKQRVQSGGIHIMITKHNLIESVVSYSVRHCIKATWINDRDQFLAPNDQWE